MSDHEVDIISQVAADHRAVEALLRDLESGQGDPADVVWAIMRELDVHAAAEELVVRPAARLLVPDGDRIVDADVDQHLELERVLARLERAHPGDERTTTDVEAARRLLDEHVAREEGAVLPRLAEALSSEKRQELGVRFLSAKVDAPPRERPPRPGATCRSCRRSTNCAS